MEFIYESGTPQWQDNGDGKVSQHVVLTGSNVKLLDAVSVTGVGSLKLAAGSYKTYVFDR